MHWSSFSFFGHVCAFLFCFVSFFFFFHILSWLKLCNSQRHEILTSSRTYLFNFKKMKCHNFQKKSNIEGYMFHKYRLNIIWLVVSLGINFSKIVWCGSSCKKHEAYYSSPNPISYKNNCGEFWSCPTFFWLTNGGRFFLDVTNTLTRLWFLRGVEEGIVTDSNWDDMIRRIQMVILTQSRDQICESVQKKERQRYFCQFDWYSTRRRRWRRRKRRESISWLLYVTSGRVCSSRRTLSWHGP